jgi:hypothetical protein
MAIRPRNIRMSHFLTTDTAILAAFLLALLLPTASRAQSSGSTKWLATFNGTGDSNGGNGASLAAVAADPEGNVYVTGAGLVRLNYCPPPESCTQAITIKYDPSGKALWKDWLTAKNAFGSALGVNGAVAEGMQTAVDSSGNAYVLFHFTPKLLLNPFRTGACGLGLTNFTSVLSLRACVDHERPTWRQRRRIR